MDVENALKLPEFAWLAEKLKSIERVVTTKPLLDFFSKDKKPEDKRKENAKKIQPIIASIDDYMATHKPWKELPKPQLSSNLAIIKNYVYAKTWSLWQDDELREKDLKAWEHIKILSSFIEPQKLDLPPETDKHPFYQDAIKDIKKIETPASPLKKLESIYECCNKFLGTHNFFFLRLPIISFTFVSFLLMCLLQLSPKLSKATQSQRMQSCRF